MNTLIILRGNSGSGKSTIARLLQKALENAFLISQDTVRKMLSVKDSKNNVSIPLLQHLLQYGYDNCSATILEGIFRSDYYNDLLLYAKELYRENTYAYYFDLSLQETLSRHHTRKEMGEISDTLFVSWYRVKDTSSVLNEAIITGEESKDEIIERILRDIRK